MTAPSRRAVLRLLLVGAGVALAPPNAVASTAVALGAPATRLRRSVFRPHVRTRFLLAGPGGTHHAVLTSVGDLEDAAPGDERQFSMVFRTGAIPEGIYSFRHPRLRTFDLYVGPIGARPGTYEAVVSA